MFIALLVTLIVLLILAGVSLSAVFSEKGIFNRAESAGNRYNEAKAREVLETVLLADGQYEKNTNSKYNQDDFLDELIKSQIEGADVKGDVAIVGDYAYELDRSVPKIGRYLGLTKDLVWPTVEIISRPTLINNGREAKFTAKATEEAKGITRIELWLNGKRIEKETITYDTPQTEIIKEFTVNKNGNYTIKAYADLMGSNKTTVEGIVPAVSFSPNGSTEWKKQHTTQIIVEETAETITEMKYVWVKDNGENEPADNLFTADCLNNRTVTGGNNTMTGQYYLWVILKTGTGENIRINKYSSNAFNFDNEGPNIISFEYNPTSANSYNLKCNAKDDYSNIAMYEIYINEKSEIKVNTDEEMLITKEFKEVKTANTVYYLTVYDKLGNSTSSKLTNKDSINIWKKYELLEEIEYEWSVLHGDLGAYFYETYEWSKTTDMISKNNEIHFKYPEEGSIKEYVNNGGTAYARANLGNTPGWCRFRYRAGFSDNPWFANCSVIQLSNAKPGKFICYENYYGNMENPSIGKWKDGYYEIDM